MKHSLAIGLILLLCSCTTSQVYKLDPKAPIIDHSTNYEENDRMLSASAELKKWDEQTLVLVNNKVSTLEKFRELMTKGKIKDVKVINDKEEIEKLKYSYKDVKAIIMAKK